MRGKKGINKLAGTELEQKNSTRTSRINPEKGRKFCFVELNVDSVVKYLLPRNFIYFFIKTVLSKYFLLNFFKSEAAECHSIGVLKYSTNL